MESIRALLLLAQIPVRCNGRKLNVISKHSASWEFFVMTTGPNSELDSLAWPEILAGGRIHADGTMCHGVSSSPTTGAIEPDDSVNCSLAIVTHT